MRAPVSVKRGMEMLASHSGLLHIGALLESMQIKERLNDLDNVHCVDPAFFHSDVLFSMIGLIMLMGIVTKNAILLVDYANQQRSQGVEVFEALKRAGPVRLKPILMTAAATIAGMFPVALGQSEGGELRAPMAVCVIGGLITSTLLTLVVVPVVYSLLDRLATRGTAVPAPSVDS